MQALLLSLFPTPEPISDNVIFNGEVPGSEILTGDQLSSVIGMAVGSPIYSSEPWLKWEIDGKTVLYSKKPYRSLVSWAQLTAAKLINDELKIVIRGKEYLLGLPYGANPAYASSGWSVNAYDPLHTHGSEWNRLMYIVTTATSNNPKPSQVGPNQAEFTELQVHVQQAPTPNGSITMCREVSGASCLTRALNGVSWVSTRGTNDAAHAYNGWRPRLELIGDSLPAGIFLGEVPVSDLITGPALAALLGLTAGTAVNSNEPWLKWSIDGKIVYYSKKPYRTGTNWDSIAAVNAVDSSRIITIGSASYKVGLPSGFNPEAPKEVIGADTITTHNSEWNRLMYPLVQSTSKYSQYGPNQASYTAAEVMPSSAMSLCKEASTVTVNNRCFRGGVDVSQLFLYAKTISSADATWRPRLELVP